MLFPRWRCCFPVVDVEDVKKSQSNEKKRKDEGDVAEKLSEMVLFSLHLQKKRKKRKILHEIAGCTVPKRVPMEKFLEQEVNNKKRNQLVDLPDHNVKLNE